MTEVVEQDNLKRIRLAVMLFYFCQGLCFSSWAARIAGIKLSLGLDNAAWGTILLMIPIGQACAMVLSGFLVAKLGSSRVYPPSLLLYTLSLVLCGFSSDQYSLIMGLIAFGFFSNFCNISINTQATIVETKYKRHIMASFHGGWSVAGFIGGGFGLLMASLNIKSGWHFCFILVFNMIVLLLNYKYLQQETRKEKARENGGQKKTKPESFLYLLGFVGFFSIITESAISDWSGVYLTEIVNVAERYAPLGLSAYMITMALGRFFVDNACEKWGKKRVIQTCGLLITAGLCLIILFPLLPTVIIGFMIVGMGTSSIIPIVYSVVGQNTKISIGYAFTIVSSICFVGSLIEAPLLGNISHAYNLKVAYMLIACAGVCIMLLSKQIKAFRRDTFRKND